MKYKNNPVIKNGILLDFDTCFIEVKKLTLRQIPKIQLLVKSAGVQVIVWIAQRILLWFKSQIDFFLTLTCYFKYSVFIET